MAADDVAPGGKLAAMPEQQAFRLVPEEVASSLDRLRRSVVASLPELKSSRGSATSSSRRVSKDFRRSSSQATIRLPPGLADPPSTNLANPPLRNKSQRPLSSSSFTSLKSVSSSSIRSLKSDAPTVVSDHSRTPTGLGANRRGAKSMRKELVPKIPPEALLEYFLEVEKIDGVAGLSQVDWSKVVAMLAAGPPNVNMRETEFGWTPFLFVAHHGKARVFGMLIDAKASLGDACNEGNSALHMAARAGHVRLVDMLLEKSVDVNTPNNNGWTALTWSAMHGHGKTVANLIEASAHIETLDAEHRTVGMWAARHGHVNIVRQLLRAGVPIEWEDCSGLTIMDHAREYLEIRSSIRAADKQNKQLLRAAELADLAAVKQALSAGAYVDSRDAAGRTALTWAMARGSEALVRLLVQRGASPHKAAKTFVDCASNAAADMAEVIADALSASQRMLKAVMLKRWEDVGHELGAGAVVDVREKGSLRTALMYAAMHDAREAILALIRACAPLESRDENGATALHFAVESNSVETTSTLHFHGANASAASYSGDTSLHVAARANNATMVQLMLAARCETEDVNAEGCTPLQVAARRGAAMAVPILLAYGADSAVKDPFDRSVFAVAVVGGSTACVQCMLEPLTAPPPICSKKELASLLTRARQEEEEERELQRKAETAKMEELNADRSGSAERPGTRNSERTGSRGSRRSSRGSRRSASDQSASRRPGTSGSSGKPKPGVKKPPDQGDDHIVERSSHNDSDDTHSEDSADSTATIMIKVDQEKPTVSSSSSEFELLEEDEDVDEDKKPKPYGRFTLLYLATRMRTLLLGNDLPYGIDHNAELRQGDITGCTPIALATQSQPDLVRLLIQKKSEVNSKDLQGNTPLMISAANGNLAVVETLLAAGAEGKEENNNGLRAADMARNVKIKSMINKRIVEKCIRPSNDSASRKGVGERTLEDPPIRLRLESLPPLEHVNEIEKELRELLRKIGNNHPLKVDVAMDPISLKPKGYAHVEFKDADEAEAVMEFAGVPIFGTNFEVIREKVPPPYVPPTDD